MRTEAEYAAFEKFAGKEAVEELKAGDAERDQKIEEIHKLKESLLQMDTTDVGAAFKQVLSDDLGISRDARLLSAAALDACCAITQFQLLELEV